MINQLLTFGAKNVAPEVLERTLIGRKDLVDEIEQDLVAKALKGQTYECLLLAPRGSGKTHLIRVLYNRLKADERLKDRIRIAYMVEDETGISSFLHLMLRIINSLVRHNEPDSHLIVPQLEEIRDMAAKHQEGAMRNLLLDYIADRTLVVLVENLDQIFHAMGEQGQAKLRDFMHEHNKLSLIATSQNLFSELDESEHSFYNFFTPYRLQRLTYPQAVELLQVIADIEENQELCEAIDRPAFRGKLRAVFELTGGNHRLLVTFYSFLKAEHKSDLSPVFLKAINDLKPYYEQFVKQLAPQQQAIVQHLSLEHKPQIAKEIARSCFLGETTVGKQMSELSKLGYVDKHKVGRVTYYELREPLMRICFEIDENPNGLVKLFVDFLSAIYTVQELQEHYVRFKYGARFQSSELHSKYLQEASLFGLALGQFGARFIDTSPELQQIESEEQLSDVLGQFGEGRIPNDADFSTPELGRRIEQSTLLSEDEKEKLVAQVFTKSKIARQQLLGLLRLEQEAEYSYQLGPRVFSELLGQILSGNWPFLTPASLREVAKLDSIKNEPGVWFLIGVAHKVDDNFEAAAEAYQRAISCDEDYMPAYLYLGRLYHDAKELNKAITIYELALKRKPNDAKMLVNAGVAYRQLDRNDVGLDLFLRAIEIDPQSEHAQFNLGNTYRDINEFDSAVSAYNRAIEINPINPSVYHNLGHVQILLQDFDSAIQSFRQAIAIDPQKAQAYFQIGRIETFRGNFESAKHAYMDALKADEEHFPALNNLGVVHFRQNEWHEAIRCFKTALQIVPSEGLPAFNLVKGFLGSKAFEDALGAVKYCLGLNLAEDEFLGHMQSIVLPQFYAVQDDQALREFAGPMILLLASEIGAYFAWQLCATLVPELLVRHQFVSEAGLEYFKSDLATVFVKHPKFQFPEEILAIGIRYFKQGEKEAIFDLSKEERKVFKEFVLDKLEEPSK